MGLKMSGVSIKKINRDEPSNSTGVTLKRKPPDDGNKTSQGMTLIRKKQTTDGVSLKRTINSEPPNEEFTADSSITIYNNQNTYLPGFPKIALIKSSRNESDLLFKIVQKGKIIFEKKLIKYGKYEEWTNSDSNFYFADFTPVNQEGDYELIVEKKGVILSKTQVSISRKKFDDSLFKAYRFFYLQRSGSNELHGNVFADDARDEITGKKVDAAGGWFDAGDFNKYIYTQWQPIWALLDLYEDKESKGPKAKYLDEAKWGNDFLSKMVRKDGSMYSAVWGGMSGMDDPPKIIGNRKLTAAQWGDPTWAGAWASAVFARMAFVNKDANYSKNLELAVRTNNYFRKNYNFRYINRGEDFQGLGGIILSDVYLWKLTKKEEYLSHAREAIRIILKHQNNDHGFFFTDKNKDEPMEDVFGSYVSYAFLEGLKSFAELFPNDELSGQIRNSIVKLAKKHLVKLGFNTPYLQQQWLDRFDRNPSNGRTMENFGPHSREKDCGTSDYILASANAALIAYGFDKDPSFKALAVNQLNWIFGINPVGYSFMTGAGKKNLSHYHHRLRSLPNVPGGKIEGAIINGIAPSLEWPNYSFDFGGSTWQSAEPWLPHNAWFIMTAVKMNDYFNEIPNGTKLPRN